MSNIIILYHTSGENGEAFKDMAAHIWAAGASLEDADFITRMLARKGLYLFETKPWQRCPSTHCERSGLCCSPRDCTIKTPTLPSKSDEMDWQPIASPTSTIGRYLAPENEEIWTKIDDEHGERNVAKLTRRGNLWFTGHDGNGMYVYYTPTHWKRT